MKIVEEQIRRLTISGVEGLDPIRVALEDIAPGKGRINIECYGEVWANYWGAMGDEDIADFFASCSTGYLANKLSSIKSTVFDPEALIAHLKQNVIRERRAGLMLQHEARKAYNSIVELDPLPSTLDGLWYMSDTMQELLGDEWWHSVPEKPNPDYEYLCRIIRAVQEALKQLKGGAA